MGGVEPEAADERGQIVGVKGGRVVVLVAAATIGMVIAAAVRDAAEVPADHIHLLFPAARVAEAAVDEYDRRSLSLLEVLDFHSVDFD